jgi:hypothetical protein
MFPSHFAYKNQYRKYKRLIDRLDEAENDTSDLCDYVEQVRPYCEVPNDEETIVFDDDKSFEVAHENGGDAANFRSYAVNSGSQKRTQKWAIHPKYSLELYAQARIKFNHVDPDDKATILSCRRYLERQCVEQKVRPTHAVRLIDDIIAMLVFSERGAQRDIGLIGGSFAYNVSGNRPGARAPWYRRMFLCFNGGA